MLCKCAICTHSARCWRQLLLGARYILCDRRCGWAEACLGTFGSTLPYAIFLCSLDVEIEHTVATLYKAGRGGAEIPHFHGGAQHHQRYNRKESCTVLLLQHDAEIGYYFSLRYDLSILLHLLYREYPTNSAAAGVPEPHFFCSTPIQSSEAHLPSSTPSQISLLSNFQTE